MRKLATITRLESSVEFASAENSCIGKFSRHFDECRRFHRMQPKLISRRRVLLRWLKVLFTFGGMWWMMYFLCDGYAFYTILITTTVKTPEVFKHSVLSPRRNYSHNKRTKMRKKRSYMRSSV